MIRCLDHPYQPRGRCTECAAIAAATDHARGAATVRAALHDAPRPPAARDPKPTPRDLDDVRRKADQEAQQ